MTGPRLRFAPSPTGHLHVGNVRTALFNWLWARRLGGTFVLRIEDTDVERSTAASEAAIYDDLRWLGLDWQEGPDVGGPYGPYRQSERGAHYAKAAEGLLDRGVAYYCFCTPEQLSDDRQAALAAGRAPKYVGRCRHHDQREAAARVRAGEPAALRFAVPAAREVAFPDLIRGRVAVSTEVVGDPVIVRSTGVPAYNFAVVVDDAAMAVSHVIRGEDHISNTPRQLLLYEALGHEPPAFAHVPLVLGPDHAPLSKRHGATSVAEFRARGVLSDALVNYLALLGWSPGADEELLPVEELARRFDVTSVSHSAAVFDVDKLAWMNRHYMKQATASRLASDALPYFVAARQLRTSDAARAYVESVLPMLVGAVDRLEEMPARVSAVFSWDSARAVEMLRREPEIGRVRAALPTLAEALEAAGDLTDKEAFRAVAARVRQGTGLKGRDLFHPIRAVLTAESDGPELDLLVPAIDRAAALPEDAVVAAVPSCRARARLVAERISVSETMVDEETRS